uniref:G protein-coupled receptor n=1 Tax=Strongyloides venezuelensis TaxID=75913 RepID=A0A0K0F3I6_STRVS
MLALIIIETIILTLSIILGILTLGKCYKFKNCHIHVKVLLMCIIFDVIMSDVGEGMHFILIEYYKMDHDLVVPGLAHSLLVSGNVNSCFICVIVVLEQIFATRYSKTYEQMNYFLVLIVIHTIFFILFILLEFFLIDECVIIFIEFFSLIFAIILCIILHFYSLKKKNSIASNNFQKRMGCLLSEKYVLNQIRRVSKQMIIFTAGFVIHSLINVGIAAFTKFSREEEHHIDIYYIISKVNFMSRNMFTPLFLISIFSPDYFKISFYQNMCLEITSDKVSTIKVVDERQQHFNQLQKQWKY